LEFIAKGSLNSFNFKRHWEKPRSSPVGLGFEAICWLKKTVPVVSRLARNACKYGLSFSSQWSFFYYSIGL